MIASGHEIGQHVNYFHSVVSQIPHVEGILRCGGRPKC